MVRFWRVLGMFALLAVVATGAAWRAASSQGSPASRASAATPRAATTRAKTTRAMLQRELQQFLHHRRARSRLLPPGPATCFVDSCSLKPCVLFIGQRQGAVAVATTSSTAALVARPPAVADQIPTSPACQGRIGPPNTFRVSTRNR